MLKAHELDIIEQVKLTKARYCRTIDTKDTEACEALLSADFVGRVLDNQRPETHCADTAFGDPQNAIPIHGPSNWVKNAVNRVGAGYSLHFIAAPEIEVVSPTQATGIWAARISVRWPEGAPMRMLEVFGHYDETYTLTDSGWLIQSLVLRVMGFESS